MGACVALGMSNQETQSKDLKSDLFLNSALWRFMCEMYCRFSSFIAPLRVGLTTSRNYLSELGIKNGDKERDKRTARNSE